MTTDKPTTPPTHRRLGVAGTALTALTAIATAVFSLRTTTAAASPAAADQASAQAQAVGSARRATVLSTSHDRNRYVSQLARLDARRSIKPGSG